MSTLAVPAIDKYVGSRIRVIRHARGMTLKQVAKKIKVEFQQLQKYESGGNRISASRLVLLARALDCSVADLFGEYAGARRASNLDEFMNVRECRNLLRKYSKLSKRDKRLALEYILMLPSGERRRLP